ncbi:ABC transporter substrate-binding protein [Phytomonospora sp. NPDC050363]|uniref:ABC transporter substrate-binding protein n=1 Tax=Phytomonospora sp. NPDC050363 TaxID=3155642 RepID=UPI0033F76A67
MFTAKPRRLTALVAATAAVAMLSACSAGSLGPSDEEGVTTLSFLVDNEASTVKTAEALAAAFSAANSDVKIDIETRPQGGEGDNIVKTRLATGDMTDIFQYNSGSLFQALNPQQNLLPLDDQSYVDALDPAFKVTVTTEGKLYGVPSGGAMGGGMLYNKRVYAELGLTVPTTWADFMANNAAIAKAGPAPVVQTYQDTWTSQVTVLADFHNVLTAQPDFAERFTANQAKFATTPAALRSFQKLQELHDAGYVNEGFASLKLEQGLKLLAEGEGVHFPMLTFTVATLAAAHPDKVADIGFFALPGDDAAGNGLTVWEPGAMYIPTTTTDARLEAAKRFLTFVASKEGCDVMAGASTPSGPFVVAGCTLPDTVPQAIKDMQPYFDGKKTSPALEFLSPVKGPALEQITVEVGSGIRPAIEGAELYDQDVEKQAQQLGLPGW